MMHSGSHLPRLTHALAALALLALTSPAAQAQTTLFYGGDPSGENGTLNQNNPDFDAFVYDDFVVDAPGGWTVTELFNLSYVGNTVPPPTLGGEYEIRQGVSEGNGGTLVTSGNGTVTFTSTAFAIAGEPVYRLSLAGLNINLAQGTYHLGFRPIVPADPTSGLFPFYFLAWTDKAGAVGQPSGQNGNAFISSNFGNANFASVGRDSDGTTDYSYGIVGTVNTTAVIPEPSEWATGGLIAATLLLGMVRARRRKTASNATPAA